MASATLRYMLGARPTLTHITAGILLELTACTVHGLISPHAHAPAVDVDVTIAFDDSSSVEIDGDVPEQSLLVSAAYGAFKGLVCRYWYPFAVEGVAARVCARETPCIAARVGVDTSAYTLTAVGYAVTKWQFEDEFEVQLSWWDGPAARIDLLLATLERYQAQKEEMDANAAAVDAHDQHRGAALMQAQARIAATARVMAEMYAAAGVEEMRPDYDFIPALASLATFTIIPRQWRGMFGLCQWAFREALEAERTSRFAEYVRDRLDRLTYLQQDSILVHKSLERVLQ